ncbi:MAG: 2OG-Fe(II) oxygenase family protein [Pseudomonadota bacterium]|nr:2OG-Fe(II) oxygenase family protein [Pseudomonadota bacterium]
MGGEPAAALCRRIIELADAFTVDIKGGTARRHRWAPEMWANVSPPGASNRHHCHPGAFWLAVCYVDDGYGGSPDRALGGELVLFDPRMPMIRMGWPDLRFKRPGRSPDHDEAHFRPASGRT